MIKKTFWDCKYLRYEGTGYTSCLGCKKTNNLCLKKICKNFELEDGVE